MIEASCDYLMTHISLYLPFKMICNNSHLEAPYGSEQKPWKDTLSSLARFIKGHTPSCIGYLLNMGSTEGNIHAIWSACSYLSGKPIKSDTSLYLVSGIQTLCYIDNPNGFSPVAFYSDSSY